ncbi:ABC transporter permease [Oleidesulfovibrio sp.]|uniref:ABC transporter permease n=1 Tax=Oleidesulfovibrio sp. TaxID=2909707 RepID=UPI003A859695
MTLASFSPRRFFAIVAKEFIQMRRDRMTLGMMLGIPLLQLILFGFAINSDPRNLPTAILSADNSPFARSIVSAMQNSTFFRITRHAHSRAELRNLLSTGEVQFALTIPENLETRILRGERPVLLLEADATDPVASSGGTTSFPEIVRRALDRDLTGSIALQQSGQLPVEIRIHADYNPEAVSQYNIVPGLMGVILTLTLVVITAVAITRERERGTMEYLLSTPVSPLEVIIGKILPYILVGYVQMVLIVAAARYIFAVPIAGDVWLVFVMALPFIGANLSMGVTFSTIAKNQLQAVQLSIFFFLPSLLLSGFMFPFRGMPEWAQAIGSILPLTHFLRIVRGVLLKGNGFEASWPSLWPILVFWLAAVLIALKRYSETID